MVDSPAYKSGDPFTRATMSKVLAEQFSPKNRQQKGFGIEDALRILNYGVN